MSNPPKSKRRFVPNASWAADAQTRILAFSEVGPEGSVLEYIGFVADLVMPDPEISAHDGIVSLRFLSSGSTLGWTFLEDGRVRFTQTYRGGWIGDGVVVGDHRVHLRRHARWFQHG